jgi:uncharacterized protein (TIGR02246 family)
MIPWAARYATSGGPELLSREVRHMWRPKTSILVCGFLLLGSRNRVSAGRMTADEQELAAIERLHQQDIAATLPGDPGLLASLWTDDAVRIRPGGRIDVGRAAIRAADDRATARSPQGRVLTYVPVVKEIRVAGEWAFEWGTFSSSYRLTPAAEVQKVRGTVLRVLRKQSDGTWKFARVMVQVE